MLILQKTDINKRFLQKAKVEVLYVEAGFFRKQFDRKFFELNLDGQICAL